MKSIRHRLTRDLLLVLAALLGVALAALGGTLAWLLTDAFDNALRTRALAVSALTEIEGGKVGSDFSTDFLRGYAAEKPRNFFELWATDGAPVLRSPSLQQDEFKPSAMGTAARPVFWNLTLPGGRRGRAVAFEFVPTAADQIPAPPSVRRLRLMVASDREELDETLGGLLAGVAGCGVLLVAAVFFVVPRVLRRGLAPLERLGDEAARIDAGSLASRFGVDGLPLELRPIAQRLNDLLARLEDSFERERRFSSNLAHELRTPVAELRSLAECALKWPEARDPETDREALAIAQQMESLVTHLLAQARSERGQMTVQLVAVEFDPLIHDVWRPLAARAAARGLTVDFALAPGRVAADPALLRAVLRNLLENVVDYTPAGGTVRLALEIAGTGATLRLANATENLEAADVGKLFDRFWRKDEARSSGSHVGLGLSLARAFATAMGWTLTAAMADGATLVFTLAGPRASEEAVLLAQGTPARS